MLIYVTISFHWFKKIRQNFILLNDNSKFDWLLSNTDNSIVMELSKFIDETFTIHG